MRRQDGTKSERRACGAFEEGPYFSQQTVTSKNKQKNGRIIWKNLKKDTEIYSDFIDYELASYQLGHHEAASL